MPGPWAPCGALAGTAGMPMFGNGPVGHSCSRSSQPSALTASVSLPALSPPVLHTEKHPFSSLDPWVTHLDNEVPSTPKVNSADRAAPRKGSLSKPAPSQLSGFRDLISTLLPADATDAEVTSDSFPLKCTKYSTPVFLVPPLKSFQSLPFTLITPGSNFSLLHKIYQNWLQQSFLDDLQMTL